MVLGVPEVWRKIWKMRKVTGSMRQKQESCQISERLFVVVLKQFKIQAVREQINGTKLASMYRLGKRRVKKRVRRRDIKEIETKFLA